MREILLESLSNDELLMLNCVNKKSEMDTEYTINWKKARSIEKIAYPNKDNKLVLTQKGYKILESYRRKHRSFRFNYRKSHIEDIIFSMYQLHISKEQIFNRINENICEMDENEFDELYKNALTYRCENALKDYRHLLDELDNDLKIRNSVTLLSEIDDYVNDNNQMLQILMGYTSYIIDNEAELIHTFEEFIELKKDQLNKKNN